jgi:signal transduction histidine kinase
LINIQKYGHASAVRFRGVSTPEGILIELADDGQGFDPKLPHLGLGLQGIEERVQLLRGQLTIRSTVLQAQARRFKLSFRYDSPVSC